MSSLSQLRGGSPIKWVTGTNYTEGRVVWSPSDYQYYMRKTTGAGSTDPASDLTNWQPTGDRAIKSIQRGVITGTNGATATISSVNTSKSELRMLGFSGNGTDIMTIPRISLTNSTTITATSVSGGLSFGVSWELTERY